MVLPTMIVLLAVSIYPFAYMLYMSTIEYSPLPQVPPTFVGLGNWAEMLQDPTIWNSWLTSAIYFGGALSLELVLGVLVALLIERTPVFRDALATTKGFPGVAGAITINAERNAEKPIVVVQVKDKKFTFVAAVQPK